MNKKSLEKELKTFKCYLKTVKNSDTPLSSQEKKIVSHTLAGMIMTLHNLMKTGAYDQYDNSSKNLFQLVNKARDAAIHYGYFNDFQNIYPEAQKILENIPESLKNNFANTLPIETYSTDNQYYQIFSNDCVEIKETILDPNLFIFKNIRTNMAFYIHKENLVIVENQLNHQSSYLIKASDTPTIFLKRTPDGESEQISFNELLNSSLLKDFKMINQSNRLDLSIKRILEFLRENPYKNIVITYKYNDKNTSITAHNLLKDFLNNKIIDEKVLRGNFIIKDFDEIATYTPNPLYNLPIRDMSKAATLSDIFYMELYLKKYNSYEDLKASTSDLSFYAKQSILLNLFEVGASSFSDRFLNSDKSKNFISFYYDYKKARNEIAHCAITDKEEKEQLINNLESYSSIFYNTISQIYSSYTKEKNRNPYANFPHIHKLDSNNDVVYNKTNRFIRLKHTSICKIINGKKYLKLDIKDSKRSYLEMDGSILLIDYNNLTSCECISPVDHIRIVEIDPDTNKISPSRCTLDYSNCVDVDQYSQTLIEAQDYFKSFPQYHKKSKTKFFSAITFFDQFGNPIYTEGLKNLIYRRFSQKVLPIQLLESSTLVIPKNHDEPMTILNKDKTIVAKVYLACINYSDGKEVITQFTKDRKQKEISYGRLLEKDLRTNEIIMTTKEGRR